MSKGDKKEEFFVKVEKCFKKYDRMFLVKIDNVTSNQMHSIRASIRDKGLMLMGKNTLIRKAMAGAIEEKPHLGLFRDHIRGNIAIVFTENEIKELSDIITSNRVAAPARVGAISQCEVIVPAGNTGMPPDKTSFFQALSIPTKVVKGLVNINSDVIVLKPGDVVSASASELLAIMDIMPFTYGCETTVVYDNGSIFGPEILSLTPEMLRTEFDESVRRITALSLGSGLPTVAAVPHIIFNNFTNLMYLSLGSDYTMDAVVDLKEMLNNPELMAAAAATNNAAATSATAEGNEEVEEEKEEEEEESDLGFDLFG